MVALDDLRPLLRFEIFAYRLGSYFVRRPTLCLRNVLKLGKQRFGEDDGFTPARRERAPREPAVTSGLRAI
jgi:hypothetical protein